jgi:hypothetical protein
VNKNLVINLGLEHDEDLSKIKKLKKQRNILAAIAIILSIFAVR